MAKNPITFAPDLRPDRSPRKVLPILSILVVAPLLAPIIMDAVALCYGQWREMLGTPTAVQTPALDTIGEQLEAVREDLWYHVSYHFQRVPWNPRVVLPMAVVVMLLGMMMLRI